MAEISVKKCLKEKDEQKKLLYCCRKAHFLIIGQDMLTCWYAIAYPVAKSLLRHTHNRHAAAAVA